MKKVKKYGEEGITIIALVITVVVLMILVSVAISSITTEKVIERAVDTREDVEGFSSNSAKDKNRILDLITSDELD